MNPIVAVIVWLWLVNGHTTAVIIPLPAGVSCERGVAVEHKILDAKHKELGIAAAVIDCQTQAGPTRNDSDAKPVDPAPHGVHQDDGSI
jgi:hypothetical protein